MIQEAQIECQQVGFSLPWGLFPSYVSVFVAEKHYTSFWTGFWNIYALFMTSVGLSLDSHSWWWVWGLFVVIIIVLFVYDELFGSHNYRSEAAWAEAVITRNFGASWITTSLN